ncbi:MAG: BadM/Rrf2 family transcriptional regulator [Parcubacteria group bacterium Gr01-1014_38]|nr:MAG: BadM/Rrf2 family transcriptional regulator [Parcubacteria group bacterium Gr01-1014_38]
MFGFSRKTDYALLLVTALARRPQEFVSVRALARTYHLPYRFSSQIVSDLARANVLEAREGVKGGYRLAREPKAVTVADILHATERGTALVSCVDQSKHYACPQKAWCGAKAGVRLLQRDLLSVLGRTTIADFLRAQSGTSLSLSPWYAARP